MGTDLMTSALQMGQALCDSSHGSMHPSWYRCSQGSAFTISPSRNSHWHIGHLPKSATNQYFSLSPTSVALYFFIGRLYIVFGKCVRYCLYLARS